MDNAIGKNIYMLRKKQGLTQEELAKHINVSFQAMKLYPPGKHLRLLDIACGEGKNAVFFARNGYLVTAFDAAVSGLEKARRLADQAGVEVNFFQADILDFRLDSEFDIIFCSGALHYIPQNFRREILENYQSYTSSGGLHAMNVFVQKPFIENPPDEENDCQYWISGELFTYYADWLITSCDEVIFDCMSGSVAHKHCMDTLYAIKGSS